MSPLQRFGILSDESQACLLQTVNKENARLPKRLNGCPVWYAPRDAKAYTTKVNTETNASQSKPFPLHKRRKWEAVNLAGLL